MPERVSARKRARDIDRAQTCALLDAGYGEGQLDPTEYQNRTTQAMQAKTLGELASLVADLQIPAHLVEAARESTPTPRTPIEGRAVAAVVVAVLAIGATALYTNRGGDTAPETVAAAGAAPIPAGEPEPIVVEAYDPVSAEGIRDFLTRYQQKFGDLLVDDVIFYPTYAFFTRALPDQPHRAQDWSFRGGFSTSRGPDGRELGTVTVDLATLDVDRLAEVLASGADRVGLPTAHAEHVFVRPDPPDDVLVSVLFQDHEERTGMIDTRMDGTVVDISPAEGR
ncbi:DUF1707 domain-containing protein [Prescottella equi]|uniref:DUF1707 domain-containing protein n=1 Tax=Rhodococcus hoagii TaxID=43767 RepID=A0AAE5IS84_RHOHA|nr:DUF1707 domain-containing protein [Prescottella equi]ERN43531.1 hypothetical protein H849_23642 [Prescottella equi NBRC 101255 = C 7]MBM4525599.1 DUF1707 domain-containing protein [Prescottella equi]MBM4627804.1 DUF1707 domain-containing protein [Prescottella equi]MBM4651400.1 DUF1707 domain-containing protein [Prescottella equi]MBM4685300.1 DUF1707 domain-containing protein [Prescottella equi]